MGWHVQPDWSDEPRVAHFVPVYDPLSGAAGAAQEDDTAMSSAAIAMPVRV